VNFAGFQSIVNDVGGVQVCLPFAINNALHERVMRAVQRPWAY
jgi:anionic cell wall polymer biosynthesis LytR-Cps2A-Psr (LCP) family protein